MSAVLKTAEIEYPCSDGKPMAETDVHRNWMYTIIHRLERFFDGQEVYVSGNLLIYYVKNNPRKSVAPDAFVVKHCKPGSREIFQIWKERRETELRPGDHFQDNAQRGRGQKEAKVCPDRRPGVFSV